MSDNAGDTQSGQAGADATDDASASADASSQGGQDQVSLLTSRLNGQTAKVGELTGILKSRDATLKELQAELEGLRTGKVSAEDAAKAQVEQIREELEAERRGRRIDSLKARFPETFSELGDDVAAVMDETKLAAIEARLKSDSGDQTPTPLRHNENKGAAGSQPAKEESAADVRARLESMAPPW